MMPARALSILIYHRVLAAPDPLLPGVPDVATFDRHMRLLKRFFRVMPLSEAHRQLQLGMLPARALSITFDDGYADNAELALPVLRRHGLHATFFIATAYLDGGRMWNDTVIEAVRRLVPGEHVFRHAGLEVISVPNSLDRRSLVLTLLNTIKHRPQDERQRAADRLAELTDRVLPRDLMMRREDVRLLTEAGMNVGGHTRTHPILSGLTPAGAEQEIADGLDDLAEIIGRRPTLFAYPNGRRGLDYGDREVELLRRIGVEAAFVTNRGVMTHKSDTLQAPRLTPLHRRAERFGLALWRAYSEPEWLPAPETSVVTGAAAMPAARN